MPPDVTLTVGGKSYDGWKTINVKRSLEQFSGSFDLGISETWPGTLAARAVTVGEECQVLLGSIPVITGYVDDVLPTYSATSHEVVIQGRDRAADLIDCSAEHKSGEWKDRTLVQIAEDLARPYGVGVIAEVDVGQRFTRFRLNDGESVWEALARAGRMRGLFFMSDGLGNLLITRAGTRRCVTSLVKGVNIESGAGIFSQRDRYQTYVVKAQHTGTPFSDGEENSARRFKVQDQQVGRHRLLILLADDEADTDTCRQRATWEKNVRIGGSRRGRFSVQGWTQENGTLWQPNRLVSVKDEFLGLSEPTDLLIVNVTYKKDKDGTTTEIEVVPPQALDIRPLKEIKQKEWQ